MCTRPLNNMNFIFSSATRQLGQSGFPKDWTQIFQIVASMTSCQHRGKINSHTWKCNFFNFTKSWPENIYGRGQSWQLLYPLYNSFFPSATMELFLVTLPYGNVRTAWFYGVFPAPRSPFCSWTILHGTAVVWGLSVHSLVKKNSVHCLMN